MDFSRLSGNNRLRWVLAAALVPVLLGIGVGIGILASGGNSNSSPPVAAVVTASASPAAAATTPAMPTSGPTAAPPTPIVVTPQVIVIEETLAPIQPTATPYMRKLTGTEAAAKVPRKWDEGIDLFCQGPPKPQCEGTAPHMENCRADEFNEYKKAWVVQCDQVYGWPVPIYTVPGGFTVLLSDETGTMQYVDGTLPWWCVDSPATC